MLLTEKVEVLLHGDRIKYYENLGYEIPRRRYNNHDYVPKGSTIIVNVEDLSEKSSNKVQVKCDNCGKIVERPYSQYFRYHDKQFGDLCMQCSKIKRERTLLEKYGVTNLSYVDSIKEKRKETCLEHFGTECSFQAEEVKEKIKDTILTRYGVENISQSEEAKKKKEEICLKHYGFKYASQAQEVKEKAIKTCLEKYGVKYTPQCKDFREKTENTCINKYGFRHYLQVPEIRRKIALSYYKNGSQSISKPQKKLYELLKTIYKNCELNYPLNSFCLDCMIEENGQKIDIEYDGQYWHSLDGAKEKDEKRNKICFDNGYKVLRIKGNFEIPTKEQLTNSISKLLNSNEKYMEIYTDWKEK